MAQADAALTYAISEAPRAWEDHASTLRQFTLILEALGEDKTWLDACRPPRSLHFAGAEALPCNGAAVRKRIDALLTSERIGFGFGALAAGVDVTIAEALLDHGAELHLVLPDSLDAFRDVSVDRHGPDWSVRFDVVLHRAETVRSIEQSAGPDHPLAIQLASTVAMGGAVNMAKTFMTDAVQLLLVADGETDAGATLADARLRETWASGGRRQHIIGHAPDRLAAAAPTEAAPRQSARLAAMLAVDLVGDAEPRDAHLIQLVEEVFPRLAEVIGTGAAADPAPRWRGETLVLTFDQPGVAADVARALAAAFPDVVRIGGHYGLARSADDPFGGGALLLGAVAQLPEQVLRSTPVGAIHVTEDFAAAVHLAPQARRLRTEYVGDLPTADLDDEMRLFSLKF